MNGKWKRILGVIGCVILLGLFVCIGIAFQASESEENRKLELRASSLQKEGTSDTESVSGSSEDIVSGSSAAGDIKGRTKASTAAIQISCRGDAFLTGSNSGSMTYPQALQTILQQNGKMAEVQDYTWETAGSLSQLYLAGIPESKLNQYIEKHKSNASGKSLSSTDTQLRSDRASKDLTRNDQNAIPVICMGYSGGWGGDIGELAEQIHLMLNTYNQTEDYVVMGLYPNGWTDKKAYDSAMSSAFGEHYLPLNASLKHPAMSDDGRQEIAQALYNKLDKLQYLS